MAISCSCHFLRFFNLETEALIDLFDFFVYEFGDYPGHDWEYTGTVTGYFYWPPPPQISRQLFFGKHFQRTYWDGIWPNEHITVNHTNSLLEYNLAVVPYQGTEFEGHCNLSPFAYCDSARFAVSGWEESWYDGEFRGASQRINTYQPGTGFGTPDTNHGRWGALAQEDGDGRRRIIADNTGMDANTYEVLWSSPIPAISMVGRLPASEHEWLMAVGGHRVHMYDAADGSFVDTTTTFVGEFVYDIETTNRPIEFVTWEENTRMARVYAPGALQVSPRNLVCSFRAETNEIRLDWTGNRSARSYSIFASNQFDESSWYWLLDVPEDSTGCQFSPQMNREFFLVTANYGEQPVHTPPRQTEGRHE